MSGCVFDDLTLADTISKLLAHATTSLNTDLFTAKTCVDQAAALLNLCQERQLEPVPLHGDRPPALARWQVSRLASFMTDNLDAQIRNSDLASLIGLSPSHFLRAFRGSFGLTPQAYLVRRRVEHAKLLLLLSSDPLVQIALSCGFRDQAHFSRIFRREAGMPPFRWRRAHGEYAAVVQEGRLRPVVGVIAPT